MIDTSQFPLLETFMFRALNLEMILIKLHLKYGKNKLRYEINLNLSVSEVLIIHVHCTN